MRQESMKGSAKAGRSAVSRLSNWIQVPSRAAVCASLLAAGCSVGVAPPAIVFRSAGVVPLIRPFRPVFVPPTAPVEVAIAPPVLPPAVIVEPRIVAGPEVVVAPDAVVVPQVVVRAPVVMSPSVVVAGTVMSAQVQEIEPLVAPIALYPDPLLSVVLPASTYPDQVAQAGQWMAANPNPADATIDAQPWEASVKALVHYPAALTLLTSDPQWTASLGSAFTSEPGEVSKAIQDLRARAVAAGSLINTAQMVVMQEGGVITVQPAAESVLYVPVFNPLVVYSERAVITFDAGYAVGPWLMNGYDWEAGTVYVGDWHGPYVYERGAWVRDRYWHSAGPRAWRHEWRFGPAPHLGHEQWASRREMRGHEGDFRPGVERNRAANGGNRGSQNGRGSQGATAGGVHKNQPGPGSGQGQRGNSTQYGQQGRGPTGQGRPGQPRANGSNEAKPQVQHAEDSAKSGGGGDEGANRRGGGGGGKKK